MSVDLQGMLHGGNGTVLLVGAGAVALVVVVLAIKNASWPYKARPLLTKPEQVVYHKLRQAFPDLVLLVQVSLAQVVDIKAQGNARGRWFGKVSAKSLDFLLCRQDFSTVAAIELDDKTHDTDIQKKRDSEKDRVLAAAKIPLLRWRAGKVPTVEAMREQVKAAVTKTGAGGKKAAPPEPAAVGAKP